MRYKRIILITVDCLRASAIGCMGSQNCTKNIDRLANNGILFQQAIANGPGTPQSFPAIFTSTYPLMHRKIILSPIYITLAEILTKNGFTCVGFHSNPFLSAFFGWNKGFEVFNDFFESTETAIHLLLKLPPPMRTLTSFLKKFLKSQPIATPFGELTLKRMATLLLKKFLSESRSRIKQHSMPYMIGEEINKHIFKCLKEFKDKKLFLWIHYMDPHSPYIFPKQWLKRFRPDKKGKLNKIRSLYNLEVEYVDYCIGKLMDFLEDYKFLEDAILILTADHGEALGEHGELGHHESSLYEELIHVPLIISGLDLSGKIEYPVGLIDISPTILDILGIKKPKTFYGKSLIPIIEGGGGSNVVISESAKINLNNFSYDHKRSIFSYRGERWKLILDNIKGTKELYDLKKDPGERNNLFEEENDLAKNLVRKLTHHILWERKVRMSSILRGRRFYVS